MFPIQCHTVAFNKWHCSTPNTIPRLLQIFVHYALHVLTKLIHYQGLSWVSFEDFTAFS